ncbi:MAG TPA: uridine kinase [Bacillales bacterium]|nr:uridine kinase [Bacillales bacterium]
MKFSLHALLVELREADRKQETIIVGIDGFGGAGKRTLAREMETLCSDVTVVEMDDFFLPSVEREKNRKQNEIGDVDWRRVKDQVLMPLSQDQDGRYQRYDWDLDQLAEWHRVPTCGIVVVEGVYATRNELAGFYDYKIWVESPRELRLQRGIERDGEDARDWWENNWMPEEERYDRAQNPRASADLLIDGTGQSAAISEGEVIVKEK